MKKINFINLQYQSKSIYYLQDISSFIELRSIFTIDTLYSSLKIINYILYIR